MRTKKFLLLAAMLLSGVCATFAQSENEHPLDFILGIYEAEGENGRNGWRMDSWNTTIKKDDSDPNKVWIYGIVPLTFANTTEGIYGIVNEDKNEIRIPVNQPIGSNAGFDVFLDAYANGENKITDEKITDFIVGTISPDGTITITPTTLIRPSAYHKGTQNYAGYYTSHRAVVFKKIDSTGSGIFLNADNFPDANFRAALANYFSIDDGDEFAMTHIQTKRLEVYRKSITDLTGIEHFTALTYLVCNNNQLTSLNISKNTALETLYCYNNQLTSLDVSKNTALTYLSCDNNQLTSLDVLKNTALTYLSCGDNQLTSLDVSNNTALTDLSCYRNPLTSLDVSKNTALTYLYCYNNQLTSLDVSKNTALIQLDCSNNQLTSLDVSKNTALTSFSCSGNQLTSLDVSKNTALIQLDCSNNQLTSLDVSKNTALIQLDCSNNQLTSLDVSKNTALKYLSCSSNQLTSLNVPNNTKLIELSCYSNQIAFEAMDALVASLPTVENGKFSVIDTKDENERNICTKSQVAVAKEKGWTALDADWNAYEGTSNLRKTTVDGIEWTYTIVSVADKTCIVGGEEKVVHTYDDYSWTETETTPAIDVNTTGAITIPLVLDGYSVIGIAPSAFSNCGISSVVVPEGVVKIGNGAFSSCKNLTSVRLPESLVRIESYAFAETKLSSITLPKGVKFLDGEVNISKPDEPYGDVFDYCELLEEVNVDEANTVYASVDGMLLTKDLKTLLFCPQLNIAEAVPEGVEDIYPGAFYRCKKSTISLPNSLKTIGEAAFKSKYLESIVIPEGVTRIEEETFEGCDKLSSITLPKGLTYIAGEAFKYCPITNIDLGESLVFIGDDAFMGTKLTSVTLPKSLLVIEGDAFMNCPLQTVISKIEEPFVIDDGAFGGEKSDYNNNSFETATLYIPYGTKAKYEATRYWNKFVNIVEMDLVPVDEDNNVDFGNGMDESDNLDGAVIRDIYYNIGDGKGEYNADEGCVVIKKTTDDGTVGELEGKDIFGEDFKSQFTGIVFKVPAGKGTIKVNAETTGNMLLKVKIGSNDPVEMELNGKLKVTFPYNVSETTYVYIYAGAANEAKGFGAPASGDAALKIYGIEFIRDNTPTDINSVDSGELTVDSWYTIDGKKLSGEPTKKGIYIYNGKKVKK